MPEQHPMDAAVKRRLVAFADTSGSGGAAALRLPSPEERGTPFVFIPSPRPILPLPASPYSNHFQLSRLVLAGREGHLAVVGLIDSAIRRVLQCIPRGGFPSAHSQANVSCG